MTNFEIVYDFIFSLSHLGKRELYMKKCDEDIKQFKKKWNYIYEEMRYI